jgi:hypothetical protein
VILVCIISISMLPAKKRNSPKKKEIVPKQTIKVNDCVLVDTDVDLYQCVCVCVCVCVCWLIQILVCINYVKKGTKKKKNLILVCSNSICILPAPYIYTYNTYVCTYMCVCMYVYQHTYPHTYVHIHAHLYAHIHTNTYAHIYYSLN